MNILFICNISLYSDGPSVHLIEDIIKQCLYEGHNVVIVMKGVDQKSRNIEDEITTSGHFTMIDIPFQSAPKNNLLKRYVEDAKYARDAARYYKNKRCIDVVFLQSCNTAAFHVHYLKKHLKTVPIVYNVQDMFPENTCAVGALKRDSIPFKILRLIQRYSYKNVARIVTISDDIKCSLEQYKEAKGKVQVVPNWAYAKKETDKKNDGSLKKMLQIPGNSYVVLYAGNIGTAQNVEMIVRSAEYLKAYDDIVIVIVGNGVRREKIEKMVENQNLCRIQIMNAVGQEYSEELYDLPDINIIPLQPEMIHYALPSKTARCLLSNSIVITCFDEDAGIVRDMKNETDVINIAPNDDYALAQLILQYYHNERSYSLEKAANFAQGHFNKEKSTKVYCDILSQSVKKGMRR